jgi:hypothetical protein
MKTALLTLLIMLFACMLQAQLMDSIKVALKSKPRLSFRFDNRHSFVSTTQAKINAVKIGAEYDYVFRMGLGYNQLYSTVTRNEVLRNNGLPYDTVTSFLKLWFISAYSEYVFFLTRRWEFSVPLQLGVGYSKFNYSYNNENFTNRRHLIAVYEAGINGHYKLIPGLGVGAGMGYSLMLIDNPAINENFNTPIYSFRIKVFLGDIYRLIVKKKRE